MSISHRARIRGVVAGLLLVLSIVAPATAVSGPTKLLDPAVSPRTGSPATAIRFEVTYRNREGSAPDRVAVLVDGVAHAMAGATGADDWKAGVRFAWSTTLPAGTHEIAFTGTDRERFSDTIDGGVVVITVPPTPTPTAPPTPRPTPTPAPTERPHPSPTATPKPTPQPTPITPSDPATPSPALESPALETPATSAGAGSANPSLPAQPSPRATSTPSPSPDETDDPGPGAVVPPPARGPDGGAEAGGSQAPGGQGDPAEAGDATPSRVGTSGWGALARAIEALGLDPSGGLVLRLLPTIVGTTGAVVLAMAFMFFGKKRRDGEPPAPDEVLHAQAARGTGLPPASDLVPDGSAAPATPAAPVDPELSMPRWRRPSLMQARRADPLRNAAPVAPRLTFDHGLVDAVAGLERRVLRYHVVRLLDAPDELRSAEIGVLDQGDEVQLLERSGAYWLVLCPDGRQGWLHKMTLGDVVGEPPAPGPRETWATGSADADTIDADVLDAFIAARGRA